MIDRAMPLILDDAAVPRGARPLRGIIWMTLVFWTSSFAALAIADALRHPDHVTAVLATRIALTAVGMIACFLIHLLLRRFAHRGFRTRVTVLALVAPVAAELFAWANYFGMRFAQNQSLAFPVVHWEDAIAAVVQWSWLFLAWAGFYFALDYAAEAKAEERRAAQLQALAQDARFRALAYQVNPHFLFNSLNAVSALMLDGRIDDAERIVTRLSRFLRRTLALDPGAEIALSEEIAIQREYLDIEQQRFPDLAIDLDVPPTLALALVPALALQPLVENAVKHGVARSGPPTQIRIVARVVGTALDVVVENSGAPSAAARSTPDGIGTGLANVRERLAQRFGADGTLTVATLGPAAFRATITLPLRFA